MGKKKVKQEKTAPGESSDTRGRGEDVSRREYATTGVTCS